MSGSLPAGFEVLQRLPGNPRTLTLLDIGRTQAFFWDRINCVFNQPTGIGRRDVWLATLPNKPRLRFTRHIGRRGGACNVPVWSYSTVAFHRMFATKQGCSLVMLEQDTAVAKWIVLFADKPAHPGFPEVAVTPPIEVSSIPKPHDPFW